jgi:hypothetical protein
MFNVLHQASVWKIDFILLDDTEYSRTAFARRRPIAIGETNVVVASPEDVILAKLRWARMGGSERHLEDVAGILRVQGSALDVPYITYWVRELQLEEQWQAAQDLA